MIFSNSIVEKFITAIRTNDILSIKKIMNSSDFDINGPVYHSSKNMYMPILLWVATYGSPQILQLIITNSKIDIHITDGHKDALCQTIRSSNIANAEILLNAKCDPNRIFPDNKKVIDYCNTDIAMRLLVKYGATLEVKKKYCC